MEKNFLFNQLFYIFAPIKGALRKDAPLEMKYIH